MKKVAILQSSYIPWKGYFDIINRSDELVIFDNMQYTRRDWRNRNRIKTDKGPTWLTIPVQVKGKFLQAIDEVQISDPDWARRHWNTISQFYTRAKYFKEYKDAFESFYRHTKEENLSVVNFELINIINHILGIDIRITFSRDYPSQHGKSERILSIVKQVGGDVYVSGPSARNYLDENLFRHDGVTVEWMDYSDYPEYNQLFPPFVHELSVIDLIFNEGPSASNFMNSFVPNKIKT